MRGITDLLEALMVMADLDPQVLESQDREGKERVL